MSDDQRFSDDDFVAMAQLLQKYAEGELDQWESWRFKTPFGNVYLNISREPFPGTSDEGYDDVSAWLKRHS